MYYFKLFVQLIVSAVEQAAADTDLNDLESSPFDDITSLLEMMKADMLSNVLAYVSGDVKARSRPYRKDKYESMDLFMQTYLVTVIIVISFI